LLPRGTETQVGDRDVEFVPLANGSPTIDDVDPFIRVGRELTDATTVDEDFLEYPRPDEGLEGWSRIVLPGGEIFPIHVVEDFNVESISVNLRLKLVKALDLDSGGTKEKHKSRVCNGLVYYRSIAQKPAVVLSDGTKLSAWDPIDKVMAKQLPKQNADPDYVAWISNAGMEVSREDFDRDFYLLYDLLENEVAVRYVPVLDKKWKDSVRNPPGQCMLAYAFG
jgi:hypothetical protein